MTEGSQPLPAPGAHSQHLLLEEIINRGPAAVFLWRMAPGFPVDFVSENVVQFGYTPEDFTSGRVSWVAITHPEDRTRLELEVGEHLAAGRSAFRQHYRLRAAGGEWRWIEDRNVVIRDSSGEITHIQGIVLDVTERHLAEEASMAIMESAPLGMLIMQDGRFVYSNPAVSRMTGLSRETLLSMRQDEIPSHIHTDDREVVRRMVRKRLAGAATAQRYEARVRRPDGTFVWLEVLWTPIHHHGQPAMQGFYADITPRKTAEAALRQTLARLNEFEAIVNRSPAVVIVCDAVPPWPARFVSGNIRQFGYQDAQLLSGSVNGVSLIHPEDRSMVQSDVEKYLRQGVDAFLQEYRILTAAGAARWVEDRTQVFRDAQGGVSHLQCILLDITERRRAEEELRRVYTELERRVDARTRDLSRTTETLRREVARRTRAEQALRRHRDRLEALAADRTAALAQSEASFRAVADNANEGILVADAKGRHVYANACARRLTGRSRSELLAMNARELFAPEDRARVRRITLRRLSGGSSPRTYEANLLARDGRRIPVEITGSPTVWRGQRCTLGMIRDISERRRAEEERRRQRELLEYGERIAGMGSWQLDLGTMRLEASRELCRIHGIAPERFDGRLETVMRTLHPGDRARVQRETAHARRSRTPVPVEYRVPLADGSTRIVRAAVVGMRNARGRVTGTAGVAQDVTEQRRLEQQLIEVSNAEKRAIGHTLHDSLGQHLTGIAFLTGALERGLAARGAAETEAARRISALIHEGITQTRSIASGLSPVDMAEEGLAEALASLAEGTRNLYGIACRCTARKPGRVRNHEVATNLYHIAQEAVTNAIRHGRATDIRIHLVTGKRPRLAVRDNGRGMPEGGSTSRGLGLDIMRHRARMAGGQLQIGSAPGGGTVVATDFVDTATAGRICD